MTRQRWRWLGGLALLATLPAVGRADNVGDARKLADRIDNHIAAGWKKAQAQPAAPATDAEFVRRVYLDLAGRIPNVAEVRAFLADKDPDKRAKLVEELLSGARYVGHWTTVWRNWMLPEAAASFQVRFLVPGFDAWVRQHLQANTPYDKMVQELLTTPVGGRQGRFAYGGGGGQANPAAYYVAKDLQPENLAASTSRMFLGVRLECAQCHAHPFAKWEREQFWSYAAFFSGIRRQNQGDFAVPAEEKPDSREITIPNSEKVVKAKFLDGKEPAWKAGDSTRKTLADWVTAKDNPYFARAAVNRLWEYFYGTGLIEPVDEMVGTDNKPSHPDLLDELAKEFAAHDFDLKFLIRAFTASKAYQLSSARVNKQPDDPHLFSRMPLRGLSPEQLYDSVAMATGYREAGNAAPPGVFIPGGPGNARAEFLTRFASQNSKATEHQSSILQALALMNGKVVEDATSLEKSETLRAVTDSPFLDTAGRIEVLYLATMSRMPKPKELSRLVQFVENGGADEGPKPQTPADREKRYNQALADVFWALLNTSEFYLNH